MVDVDVKSVLSQIDNWLVIYSFLLCFCSTWDVEIISVWPFTLVREGAWQVCENQSEFHKITQSASIEKSEVESKKQVVHIILQVQSTRHDCISVSCMLFFCYASSLYENGSDAARNKVKDSIDIKSLQKMDSKGAKALLAKLKEWCLWSQNRGHTTLRRLEEGRRSSYTFLYGSPVDLSYKTKWLVDQSDMYLLWHMRLQTELPLYKWRWFLP